MTGTLAYIIKPLRKLNLPLLICMAALLGIGVAFIHSATATREGAVRYLHLLQIKQWIPVGLLFHLILARLNYRKLVDWAWLPYLLTLGLLILVLIPGIGTMRFAARRWLFGFQPSEFAKVTLIPAVTYVLTGIYISKPVYRLLLALLATAVPLALIVLQPDLGTAMVLLPTLIALLFVAGCAPRALAAMLALVAVAALFFAGLLLGPELIPMSAKNRSHIEKLSDRLIYPHWKNRALTFVFPDRDPLGAGWSKRQSEIAVGSGGRHGKGYRNGTQNILGFLPRSVSPTDFIFSVIAEEMGYNGSVSVLLLYAVLFGSIAWIGIGCRDSTGRLLCTGVGTIVFVHVFVNIAMTVGRVPITGIPLPLVSYGGSFTIATMALLGLVQSVALHGKEKKAGFRSNPEVRKQNPELRK